jgi:hypothetical protein
LLERDRSFANASLRAAESSKVGGRR